MSYNVAEYDIGWRFNGLRDGETMADLPQTVFARSNNEAFKQTNTTYTKQIRTYGHAPTN